MKPTGAHPPILPVLSAFGPILYTFRTGARLSQAALAERCGLNHGAISRLENGMREPKFQTIERLCTALVLDDFEADSLFLAAGRVRNPQMAAYLALDFEFREIVDISQRLTSRDKTDLRSDLKTLIRFYEAKSKGTTSHDRAA